MQSRQIVGMRVDATSYPEATQSVVHRATLSRGGYVCVANVHMAMEVHDSERFDKVVNGAFLVTPDGRPLVWMLRALGIGHATQVRGANLVESVVKRAAEQRVPIGLYGGTPDSLSDFVDVLERRYPGVEVACAISPPFRPLTPEEDDRYTAEISRSGAKILFVGIGCPKQENWMYEHRNSLSAVMLGVGAAFDFHTGRVKEAPVWMQRCGLEWVFRLYSDPGRLWKRYARHNPRFMVLAGKQIWDRHRAKRTSETATPEPGRRSE